MMAKPMPLISGADTQKNLGVLAVKPGPDKSEPGFTATPRYFFVGVSAKTPAAWVLTLFTL
jgi:hypothetical protein